MGISVGAGGIGGADDGVSTEYVIGGGNSQWTDWTLVSVWLVLKAVLLVVEIIKVMDIKRSVLTVRTGKGPGKVTQDSQEAGPNINTCAVPRTDPKPGVPSASISWWMLKIARRSLRRVGSGPLGEIDGSPRHQPFDQACHLPPRHQPFDQACHLPPRHQPFDLPKLPAQFHLTENPASAAGEQNRVRLAELQTECYNLRECIRALEAGNCTTGTLSDLPQSREVSELQKQLDSLVMKNQRLKEVFQKKIQEFRTVCYILFGYMLDFQQDGQYKLTSMYAEQEADSLLFKQLTAQENGVQLLETEFSKSEAVLQLIELHLHHQKSFPAFLSALTLDLFSRQTCM
uniref:uncharacterized protein n=1 Tax=Myxine glutinosa TaxID=7769 RepID=UPI00358EAD51